MNKFRPIILLAMVSFVLNGCSYMPSWMGGKTEEKPKLTGERIPVLPVNNELEADASLQKTPIVLPAATSNDSWPQHGGNFNAGTSNLATRGAFDKITHATIGKDTAFENTLIVSPVVGGGFVYAMDQVGNISAHDAADINKVIWQYSGVVEADEPVIIGGGLAYDTGKLYVASGRGVIAAVDATTGKEIWHKSLHLSFRSAPKIADGKLFAITLDNQTYALNITDGNVLWTHRGISETGGLMNSISPTVEGDLIVIPYSSGEIYVLSTTDGKEIWSDSLSSGKHTKANALFAGVGGDPVVDGGVIFSVGSGGVISVKVLGSGQPVWERSIGSVNTPWITGDSLFMLTTDKTLVNLVKFSGHIRWDTQLASFADPEQKKNPITWKGPVMVDGKLAVVGSNGQLLLISAEDGKIVTTQTIPEDIYTAPVVANGRMYLVGQDATLYSLQ